MAFSKEQIEKIDAIFTYAVQNNRQTLYEHEVYQILGYIGLEIPRFKYVSKAEDVDEKLCTLFNHDIMVKIVSPDIAHKQKLGGVKRIKNLDHLFIQFVLNKMEKEVLSHFDESNKPRIEGFLIAEFLPHTQAIGYEVLFGIKEDRAFGPVLTLSKGGDDAEFFSKYYDPANLFIAPLDYDYSHKMVQTLNIRHKFKEIGHLEYLDYFAHATAVRSELACYYSFASGGKNNFIIKSLDINPFIISEDNRFIAIDGFCEFTKSSDHNIRVPEINLENLDGLFKPQGIAVIGVSANIDKYNLARDIAHLLHDMNRQDLFFINPKGGTVRFGEKEYTLYKDLDAIRQPVDLIVYAAPAKFIIDFLKNLPAQTRPKAIILIPGIPADMHYTDFARSLDAVKPKGTRIIGPNCMGVYVAPDAESPGLNTLFIEEERLEIRHSQYSNVVLLTQSGGFSVTAIDKFQNSSLLRSIVSFGNKYDVKITDLMAYFAKKDTIHILSLYIEGLDPGEGRQFFRLAQTITKPIIVYKAGKTDAGAKAAASHTASMSGSYDVFKAASNQSGVILVENIEEYYDLVKTFSLLHAKIPANNRVAGVVNAGFESTVGADELKNLRQAQFSEKTIKRLNEINRFHLVDTTAPFLDISPMADDKMYADFVEAILMDDNVDCVFVAVVPHTVSIKTAPETCHDPDSLGNLLIELNNRYDKPMVVSVNAGQYYQEFVTMLKKSGLPVFEDIRQSIRSLDVFVTYHTGDRRL